MNDLIFEDHRVKIIEHSNGVSVIAISEEGVSFLHYNLDRVKVLVPEATWKKDTKGMVTMYKFPNFDTLEQLIPRNKPC